MLQMARAGQQRQLLGVSPGESRAELKHRFYQLARRFHPDRHMDHPEWKPRLEALMDALALAYRSLAGEENPGITGEHTEPKPEAVSEARSLAQQFAENAQACLATKNYAGSIVWLRRAIQAEPQVSKYRALLGVSLAQVPEYRREALEQFEKAIEIAPGDPSAYFHYGQVLEQMKQPWRARTCYLRVLELDPLHREARKRLEQLKAAAPRAASLPFLLDRLTGRTRE